MATKVKNHRLDKPADNTAYGPSWSGVIDQAPSKDAIYNKVESLSASIPTVGTGGYAPRVAQYREVGGYGFSVSGKGGYTDNINYIPTFSTSGGGVYSNVYYVGTTDRTGKLKWYENVGSSPHGVCVKDGYLFSLTGTLKRIQDGSAPSTIFTVSGYVLNGGDFLLGNDGTYFLIGRDGTTDIRRFSESGGVMTYVDTITAPFTLDMSWSSLTFPWCNDNGIYRQYKDATIYGEVAVGNQQAITKYYTYGGVAGETRLGQPIVVTNDSVFITLGDGIYKF